MVVHFDGVIVKAQGKVAGKPIVSPRRTASETPSSARRAPKNFDTFSMRISLTSTIPACGRSADYSCS